LTAAHCATATYKIVEWRGPAAATAGRENVAIHPPSTWYDAVSRHCRRGAAQLDAAAKEEPARSASLFPLSSAAVSPSPASASPFGGDGKRRDHSCRRPYCDRAGTLQIRLVDPLGQGARRTGARPGFADRVQDKQSGPAIVGVVIVDWPNGAVGCGGLTGATPRDAYGTDLQTAPMGLCTVNSRLIWRIVRPMTVTRVPRRIPVRGRNASKKIEPVPIQSERKRL
jgi:hypothetical protein